MQEHGFPTRLTILIHVTLDESKLKSRSLPLFFLALEVFYFDVDKYSFTHDNHHCFIVTLFF